MKIKNHSLESDYSPFRPLEIAFESEIHLKIWVPFIFICDLIFYGTNQFKGNKNKQTKKRVHSLLPSFIDYCRGSVM